MKEDTRWKLIIATGLILLSLALFTAHYLIFHDEHHLSIFFLGDLAFIPIEVLVVTLIIDQMLESREKQRRMEKLNMVIGTFFSTLGTPLIARLTGADDTIGPVKERLVVTANWNAAMFYEMRKCLDEYSHAVSRYFVSIWRIYGHFLSITRNSSSVLWRTRWCLNTNRLRILSLHSIT